jgi:hypothetical protein
MEGSRDPGRALRPEVPHLVEDLEHEALGIDAVTGVGRHGDAVGDSILLALLQMRLAAATGGCQ